MCFQCLQFLNVSQICYLLHEDCWASRLSVSRQSLTYFSHKTTFVEEVLSLMILTSCFLSDPYPCVWIVFHPLIWTSALIGTTCSAATFCCDEIFPRRPSALNIGVCGQLTVFFLWHNLIFRYEDTLFLSVVVLNLYGWIHLFRCKNVKLDSF